MRSKPALELQTTTLWYYPSQQYGGEPQGDPRFAGATPSYVIWNLFSRYTRPGDLVVDPFCGGGTTLDVAKSLGRRAFGCDIAPRHAEIVRADARQLPLRDRVADFVFMDPPYSTHIEYSDDPRCIGRIEATESAYFEALELAFHEAARVLKDRRYLAVYAGDTFGRRQGFVGIGAALFSLLAKRFRPIDHIAVVRGNRMLEKPRYHAAAAEGNFFLRGFNHLLIFKQEETPVTGREQSRRTSRSRPR